MTVNLFLPQVTRIPITGPAPYNTLVCVSAEGSGGSMDITDGKIHRTTERIATPFRLAGFDQRVPPKFDHSTTAWLTSFGPFEDCNWALAVDSVTETGFSPYDGSYYIDITTALGADDYASETCGVYFTGQTICFYYSAIRVTSWVLCYEPPTTPIPPGHGYSLNDFIKHGIPPAELARNPAQTPGSISPKEYTMQKLQQLGVIPPVTFSAHDDQTRHEDEDCSDCGDQRRGEKKRRKC